LGANYWPAALRVVSAALVSTFRWIITTGFVERKIDAALEAATKVKVAKEKKEKERESEIGRDIFDFHDECRRYK
jgi:hypothetical protein